MRKNGWRRFGWYVWDQGPGLPGDWNGRLAPSFEFVWHFNKESKRPAKWIATKAESQKSGLAKKKKCRAGGVSKGMRGKDGVVRNLSSPEKVGQSHKIPDNVLRIQRECGNSPHPAVFPIALPTFIIKSWPGLILDPFLGSGTTLIAAEQLGRTCCGLELEPTYIDVILTRYANLTGDDPVREDGMKWSELNG